MSFILCPKWSKLDEPTGADGFAGCQSRAEHDFIVTRQIEKQSKKSGR